MQGVSKLYHMLISAVTQMTLTQLSAEGTTSVRLRVVTLSPTVVLEPRYALNTRIFAILKVYRSYHPLF